MWGDYSMEFLGSWSLSIIIIDHDESVCIIQLTLTHRHTYTLPCHHLQIRRMHLNEQQDQRTPRMTPANFRYISQEVKHTSVDFLFHRCMRAIP